MELCSTNILSYFSIFLTDCLKTSTLTNVWLLKPGAYKSNHRLTCMSVQNADLKASLFEHQGFAILSDTIHCFEYRILSTYSDLI